MAAAPPLPPRTRRGFSVAGGGGSSAPRQTRALATAAAAAARAQAFGARMPFAPAVEGAAAELSPEPGAWGRRREARAFETSFPRLRRAPPLGFPGEAGDRPPSLLADFRGAPYFSTTEVKRSWKWSTRGG